MYIYNRNIKRKYKALLTDSLLLQTFTDIIVEPQAAIKQYG